MSCVLVAWQNYMVYSVVNIHQLNMCFVHFTVCQLYLNRKERARSMGLWRSTRGNSRSTHLAHRNPGLALSTAEEWGNQQLLRNMRCRRMVLSSYQIQCTDNCGEVGKA